jgi:general secretion pathway protein B
MSFILDALKKSELERQRQSIPGLVDAGSSRSRSRLPRWALSLGVLLAVNLLVLAVVLMRGSIGSTPSTAAAPERGPASPARAAAADAPAGAAAGRDHFSPLDAAPAAPDAASEYAPEIPLTEAPEKAAPAPPAARAAADEAQAGRQPHRRDPVLNEDDYHARDEEVLPTINEISLSGAQALPELHLDVHVYATNSAERFVYINMRKYHEGATLEEGPKLERIRRDGVILDYQGLRFLLPRQ